MTAQIDPIGLSFDKIRAGFYLVLFFCVFRQNVSMEQWAMDPPKAPPQLHNTNYVVRKSVILVHGGGMMEKKQKNDKIKIIIIILAVLLGISSVSLAGMLIYKQFAPSVISSVILPDNIIDSDDEKNNFEAEGQPSTSEEKDIDDKVQSNTASTATTSISISANTSVNTYASTSANVSTNVNTMTNAGRTATKISLHSKSTEYNVPFNTINMFPGDTETKYFCVQVSYREGVTVRFTADVRSGYEKLAEVLKCKVVLLSADKTLYDGLMKDMPESLEHYLYNAEETTSELYYEITAYLDSSVGNEYQNKSLAADFHWWVDVEDEEHLTEAPKTGDETNILLWVSLWGTSLCMLLLLWMKKKKEIQHDAR